MNHKCHAIDCSAEISPRLLMCLKHWRLVPAPLQAAVYGAYRPGQEIDKQPSAEYLKAQKAAVEAVAVKERKLEIWACGCQTWTQGTQFTIKPCSTTCRVYLTAIEQSQERGNRIEYQQS